MQSGHWIQLQLQCAESDHYHVGFSSMWLVCVWCNLSLSSAEPNCNRHTAAYICRTVLLHCTPEPHQSICIRPSGLRQDQYCDHARQPQCKPLQYCCLPQADKRQCDIHPELGIHVSAIASSMCDTHAVHIWGLYLQSQRSVAVSELVADYPV